MREEKLKIALFFVRLERHLINILFLIPHVDTDTVGEIIETKRLTQSPPNLHWKLPHNAIHNYC